MIFHRQIVRKKCENVSIARSQNAALSDRGTAQYCSQYFSIFNCAPLHIQEGAREGNEVSENRFFFFFFFFGDMRHIFLFRVDNKTRRGVGRTSHVTSLKEKTRDKRTSRRSCTTSVPAAYRSRVRRGSEHIGTPRCVHTVREILFLSSIFVEDVKNNYRNIIRRKPERRQSATN